MSIYFLSIITREEIVLENFKMLKNVAGTNTSVNYCLIKTQPSQPKTAPRTIQVENEGQQDSHKIKQTWEIR